jgi:hypothetical protein
LNYKDYCLDATSLATMRPMHTAALMMVCTFVVGPLTYVDIGLAAVNLNVLWLISFKEILAHLTPRKLTGMQGGLLKTARFGDEEVDWGPVKSGTKTSKWPSFPLAPTQILLTYPLPPFLPTRSPIERCPSRSSRSFQVAQFKL